MFTAESSHSEWIKMLGLKRMYRKRIGKIFTVSGESWVVWNKRKPGYYNIRKVANHSVSGWVTYRELVRYMNV